MKLRYALASFVLLFAGCSSPPPEAPAPEPVEESMPAPTGASYVETAGTHAGIPPFVLFFSKPTDPFSIRSDSVLRVAYGSGAAKLTTYRFDFDTATGARLTYGVFVEDTFVIVSASGSTQSIVHPTGKQIREIVKTGRILP